VDSTLQTAPFDVRLLDGVLERIASGPALVRREERSVNTS
jgi:hypothetical protein